MSINTVSSHLLLQEENIIRRIKIAKEALKTGLHPKFTIERPIMVKTKSGFEVPTGKTETVQKPLNSWERRNFKNSIKLLEKKTGKISFYKIVPRNNCFSVNYNTKTLSIVFKGESFEFDLTQGDRCDYTNSFKFNGEIYDVCFSQENETCEPSVVVLLVRDNVVISDSEVVLQPYEILGDFFEYFNS